MVTRRKVRAAVPAGRHSVTLRLKSEGCFYFDFLEAAVAGDIPEPLPPSAQRIARPRLQHRPHIQTAAGAHPLECSISWATPGP